jgi:hypothetical protein
MRTSPSGHAGCSVAARAGNTCCDALHHRYRPIPGAEALTAGGSRRFMNPSKPDVFRHVFVRRLGR